MAAWSSQPRCRPAVAMNGILPSVPAVRPSSQGLEGAAMHSTVIFVNGVGLGLAVFFTQSIV